MKKSTYETYGAEVIDTRSNPLLGIVGAIVGALIGAVLWVVLYQIGIIASIAGIAIVYCACKGYAMLSKSTGLGGVIISIVISVVILVATVFLCWGMDIYSELSTEYTITLIDAIMFVPKVAFSGDLVVEFVKEILMGLILIGVGATPFLRLAVHNNNKV